MLWKELMLFDGTVPGFYFSDCYYDFWDYLNYSYVIGEVKNYGK
jgi:hypothetical protein